LDRSLWLLLRLRTLAWFRRKARAVNTPRGALLAVLGSLVLLPMLAPILFAPRIMIAFQLELLRRYGPLALPGYCLLNVLLSTGDRAVDFSPAEVGFLFCGPYRPRQLSIYKLVVGVCASLVTALLMTLAFSQRDRSPP